MSASSDTGMSKPVTELSARTASQDSDDWETMLDSGQLDASLDRMSVVDRCDPAAATVVAAPDLTRPPPVRILVNEARTQYRPPEQKLTILKRPAGGGGGQGPGQADAGRQKTPSKTLEQREAEYAQARQRILGGGGGGGQGRNEKSVVIKGKNSSSREAGGGGGVTVGVGGGGGGATRNPRGTDGTRGFGGGGRQSSNNNNNNSS